VEAGAAGVGQERRIERHPFYAPQIITFKAAANGRSTTRAQTRVIEARVTQEGDNYRYQMFVNGLVAAFVGMLVMSGQWMFTILASIP
jgi:hypothetical protein